MKLGVLIGIPVLVALRLAPSQPGAPAALSSTDDIRKILVNRIETEHRGVGIVVGVIDDVGRRVISYGGTDSGAGRNVDGNTVFEIGSATKVFTSLLLADAVQRDEVALTDPVSKCLPSDVKVPERGGRMITLADLATHTSGLPRLPANLAPKDPSNPYADYSVAQLYAFLSSYQLPREIGSKYEYSNLGAGLLGHALSRRAGMDYESLVRTRVTEPLGMTSTAITLNDALKARLAPGHDATGARVANWDIPTLAGAGALRSTANDLLTLLAAELRYASSPLAAAMDAMLKVRRPTGTPGLEIALGWHVRVRPSGGDIVWHNGGTGGYRSIIAFNPVARTGVIVLSNMNTDSGVDDIGQHILDPSVPLTSAPVERKEVAVAADVLERYVGNYQLAPTFLIRITREGGRLFLQATGQPRFELFASAEREFFLKAVDAQITFNVDDAGRVTGLVLHQAGAHQPAKRIE